MPERKGPAGIKLLSLSPGERLFAGQGSRNPKKLQSVMGHSSIQVTFDIYGHLFPSVEDDAKEMAQIEARLLG